MITNELSQIAPTPAADEVAEERSHRSHLLAELGRAANTVSRGEDSDHDLTPSHLVAHGRLNAEVLRKVCNA